MRESWFAKRPGLVAKAVIISLVIVSVELLVFPFKTFRSEQLHEGMSLSDAEEQLGCKGQKTSRFWTPRDNKCGVIMFFEYRWEDATTEIDGKVGSPFSGAEGKLVAIKRTQKSSSDVIQCYLLMTVLLVMLWTWVFVHRSKQRLSELYPRSSSWLGNRNVILAAISIIIAAVYMKICPAREKDSSEWWLKLIALEGWFGLVSFFVCFCLFPTSVNGKEAIPPSVKMAGASSSQTSAGSDSPRQ